MRFPSFSVHLFFSASFRFFPKVVRVPVLWVPFILASRTLGTGGTQSFQAPRYRGDWRDSSFLPPRYPGDWRDSVLSASQVPWGLAGLSPFRPPGTLGTGGTESFQAPRYPEDSRNSVLSAPQVPCGLCPPTRTGACESLSESRGLVLVLLSFAVYHLSF